MERPYVVLSCAISLDGYLDDASQTRLVLSGAADLDRVDELRASVDAILVGAGTIRADNPRLLLRSRARREGRVARGLASDPIRVVVSGSGELDPGARLFTHGESARVVYVRSQVLASARSRLDGVAEVVAAGDPVDLDVVLADLSGRGVGRLMVEGGSSVLTQFLTGGLADELQLAIAPIFVGDSRAPRFVLDGSLPSCSGRPARLVGVSQVGQDAVLRYRLGVADQPDRGGDRGEEVGGADGTVAGG
ncbi:MAG TPA: dihydrofolate reductase family protein [Streptosporangiaceae bacterium]|nr:dihydrofolate reductase family protein [Streptosporangiaceae bacterium]